MAKYRKLGRTSDQRKALIRNQVTALIYNGKIRTTEARAKEIRKVAEGLIAMAAFGKCVYQCILHHDHRRHCHQELGRIQVISFSSIIYPS